MTVRQYTEYVRDPLKAAQRLATTERAKLPGGLGEDGLQYQKNNENEGDVLVYRGEEKIPQKIIGKD